MSEEKLNIYQRKHKVMEAVDYLEKTLRVRYLDVNYKGVAEEKVIEAVRPELLKWGLDVNCVGIEQLDGGKPDRMRAKYQFRWTNIDNPAEYFDTFAIGDGKDKADKGPGKAHTYASKYNLLKSLLLATGDDPDKKASQQIADEDEADKYIPSAKVDRLWELAEAKKLDSTDMLAFLSANFGLFEGKLLSSIVEYVKDKTKLEAVFAKKRVSTSSKYFDLLLDWGREL